MFTRFLIATFLFAVCFCNNDKPLIKTPLGVLQGYLKTSHGGRKFGAFEGIPYAEPPIGNRRFEQPEPIKPWYGIWNATYLTECSQTNMMDPTVIQGTEDCLHINVYVPHQNSNPKKKLDVIVHIHGGGYMYGSGHWYCHPEFIMDRDVIFVTFNYRLEILGFLSTEDDVVSGNNGLKDQVLALKWIQDNVESFGGNPDSVTLTGTSAGGSSVHLHYLSEMSKGLFHRGISHSGVALNSFSLQKKSLNKAKRLAEAVGCPSTSSQVLVNCLKERPFEQLLKQMPLFFGYRNLPVSPFGPVVEKGLKPFLTADPYYLLSKGQVQDIPWIVSNTAHEGLIFVRMLSEDEDNLGKNWESLASIFLDFNYTLPRTLMKKASEQIKKFYLGEDQGINPENMDKWTQMFGDRIFTVDAETAARSQAKVTKSPVYYYLFSYPGDNNKAKVVVHAGDIKYFFGDFFDPKPLTSNELKMKDLLLDMVVSYAKTGKPVIKGVEWKPTKYDKLTYIDIKSFEPEDIKVETVEELTPRGFWKSLGILENENLMSLHDEL